MAAVKFDYDKFRRLARKAVCGAIERNIKEVLKFDKKHRANAVSFDLIPWQAFVSISFRGGKDADEICHRPGDWTGYELIGEHNADKFLDPVSEYIMHAYDSVCTNPTKCQEVAHVIYMAAADALMCPKVGKLLEPIGAHTIRKQIPYQAFAWFEYCVFDEDRVFKSNYCEIVCAQRAARKLLGKSV